MAEKRGTSSDDKNSGANRSFNEAPSVSPLTVSDDKSDSAIPPWKKELMNAKRGKSIKPTSNVPGKFIYMYICKCRLEKIREKYTSRTKYIFVDHLETIQESALTAVFKRVLGNSFFGMCQYN